MTPIDHQSHSLEEGKKNRSQMRLLSAVGSFLCTFRSDAEGPLEQCSWVCRQGRVHGHDGRSRGEGGGGGKKYWRWCCCCAGAAPVGAVVAAGGFGGVGAGAGADCFEVACFWRVFQRKRPQCCAPYETIPHTHTQNNRNIKVISFFFQKRKFILVLRWCRDQSQQA